MVPYDYHQAQPTPWLWVSEGITDDYADLARVRGGIIDSTQFMGLTANKANTVDMTLPTALEDASLSTWIHPEDGSGYIYYPKGSLAGLLLDIQIRDASDNARSLDDVMRKLYQNTYKKGRGFTAADFWPRCRGRQVGDPSKTLASAMWTGGTAIPSIASFRWPGCGSRWIRCGSPGSAFRRRGTRAASS